jgi:3-hydroxyisobutyrate dehydrogenase-like beta-hydroxyacid dehydrogenase
MRWPSRHGTPHGKKSDQWVEEYGGRAARTAKRRLEHRSSFRVGNDDDLHSVMLRRRCFAACQGRDRSRQHHRFAAWRELYAVAVPRHALIDAPVSGGQAGAVNGALTVMCGGDLAPFELAQPVAMAFAKAVTRIGESGAGQLAKMVNQICIAGLVQGLAEGISFGQAAGLDMKLVLQVIGKGAAQSWQMDNRGSTMIDDKFDFGFAVDWMRKDLGLCLDEAAQAPPPVAAPLTSLRRRAGMGGRRWDTSSLVRRLRHARK